MTRAHLVTAVAVVIACGCTQSSVEPDESVGIKGGFPPGLESIRGTIIADAAAAPVQVYVQLGADERVKVVGSEAHHLMSLAGAEVELHGRWTSQALPVFIDEPVRPPFALADFVVLAVGGREAMDGVLGEDLGRFYLRLTAGDAYWFANAPSEFHSHIGKRIWVTGWRDRAPWTYGLID